MSKQFSNSELVAVTAAIERLLMASSWKRNPIFIGLEREEAICHMPDLYRWLDQEPENPSDRLFDRTGRDKFVPISTDRKNAHDILVDVRSVRESYRQAGSTPGPHIFVCKDAVQAGSKITSMDDLEHRELDCYAAIAIAMEVIASDCDGEALIACNTADISPQKLKSALGKFILRNDFIREIRALAPVKSITFSSNIETQITILTFSGQMLKSPAIAIRDSHLFARCIDIETPLYSEIVTTSLSRDDIRNHVDRYLATQRGVASRFDCDYLVDTQKVANELLWYAEDGCDRISYNIDISKFGLEVSSLDSYINGDSVANGAEEAHLSGYPIAVCIDPGQYLLEAFRMPCSYLPPDSKFFCFNPTHIDPDFVVMYLNTRAVQNFIIARSSGPLRTPFIGRQSLLSIPVPAATPDDYAKILTRSSKFDFDRIDLENIGTELQRLALCYACDEFELGHLQFGIDPDSAKPMYEWASKILEQLESIVHPSMSVVIHPPFPMAVALRSIENSVSNIERLKRLFDASETCCRVMCYLLASKYGEDSKFEYMRRKLDIARGSVHMTFGDWVGWLRNLHQNESATSSRTIRQALEVLEQIVPMRNSFSHGMMPTELGALAQVQRVKPLFDKLCNVLPEATGALWVFGTEVVKRRDGVTWRGYSLNGDHPDFQRQTLDLPGNDPRLEFPAQEIHSLYDGRWKSLWPWIILDQDQDGHRRLFWWDGLNTRGEAKYSPIGSHGNVIYRELEGQEIRNMILQK